MIHKHLSLKKCFFCCVPFGCLNFFWIFSTMNQNRVQESILAWLQPHFHLACWVRWDLNPQSFDCESSLRTTRPADAPCLKKPWRSRRKVIVCQKQGGEKEKNLNGSCFWFKNEIALQIRKRLDVL